MKKVYTGNAVKTTSTGSLTNVATGAVLGLTASTNWPTAGPFVIVLEPGVVGKEEWVLCDSQAAGTVTINASGRGYMGTPNVAHTTPFVIEPKCVDAIAVAELNAFVNMMTAKGDLPAFDGTNPIRLPAPTVDGQVLRRLAAATSGLEWNLLGTIPVATIVAPVDGQLSYNNTGAADEGLAAFNGLATRSVWNKPWSQVVQPQVDAGAQTGITTVTDLVGCSFTFSALTRRWLRYHCTIDLNINPSFSGSTTVQLCDGSNTILAEWQINTAGGPAGLAKDHLRVCTVVRAESTGSITRKLRCTGNGLGIYTESWSPVLPTQYWIEDIGPVTGAPV